MSQVPKYKIVKICTHPCSGKSTFVRGFCHSEWKTYECDAIDKRHIYRLMIDLLDIDGKPLRKNVLYLGGFQQIKERYIPHQPIPEYSLNPHITYFSVLIPRERLARYSQKRQEEWRLRNIKPKPRYVDWSIIDNVLEYQDRLLEWSNKNGVEILQSFDEVIAKTF